MGRRPRSASSAGSTSTCGTDGPQAVDHTRRRPEPLRERSPEPPGLAGARQPQAQRGGMQEHRRRLRAAASVPHPPTAGAAGAPATGGGRSRVQEHSDLHRQTAEQLSGLCGCLDTLRNGPVGSSRRGRSRARLRREAVDKPISLCVRARGTGGQRRCAWETFQDDDSRSPCQPGPPPGSPLVGRIGEPASVEPP